MRGPLLLGIGQPHVVGSNEHMSSPTGEYHTVVATQQPFQASISELPKRLELTFPRRAELRRRGGKDGGGSRQPQQSDRQANRAEHPVRSSAVLIAGTPVTFRDHRQ